MPQLDKKTYLSIVVPFYNEQENVGLLWDKIYNALEKFGKSYEVIFVDDGSNDGTREKMRELAAKYPQLRIVLFRANFGQSAAMAAGFEATRGEVVVAMDGVPGQVVLELLQLAGHQGLGLSQT